MESKQEENTYLCNIKFCDENEKLAVVKSWPLSNFAQNEEFSKEAKILKKLDHPNVLKIYDVYKSKRQKIVFATEYAENGTLD